MNRLAYLVTPSSLKIHASLLLYLLFSFTAAYADNGYLLIVNQKNTANPETLKMSHVKNMFLSNKLKWADGQRAKPFLPEQGTDQYTYLLNTILKTSERKLKQHWLQLKQRKGMSSPPEVANDRVAVKMVSGTAGALAIVKSDALLPDSVKVLLILP